MSADRTTTSWVTVGQAAAALAAAMGVGRFVFTPILPMMTQQAGLTASDGANLATANYVGYLIGAATGIVAPRVVRSSVVLRGSLVTVVATVALMPATDSVLLWGLLRLVAGVASALTFVVAVGAMHDRLTGRGARLVGFGFAGVGAGIALSGVLVLAVRATAGWGEAWLTTAALALLLTIAAWRLPAGAGRPSWRQENPEGTDAAKSNARPRTGRWFAALFVCYSLEGVGYIIAGTFLVAAVDQNAPAWVGSGAWVLVGAAAIPAPILWARLSTRIGRPLLLLVALTLQAAGVALPALVPGLAAALVAAVLFGATFMGVTSMCLDVGSQLRFPRAVAILTAGYGIGQILGPEVVKPLLHDGYHPALLVGAGIVLGSAAAAGVLRVGFPHQVAQVE